MAIQEKEVTEHRDSMAATTIERQQRDMKASRSAAKRSEAKKPPWIICGLRECQLSITRRNPLRRKPSEISRHSSTQPESYTRSYLESISESIAEIPKETSVHSNDPSKFPFKLQRTGRPPAPRCAQR